MMGVAWVRVLVDVWEQKIKNPGGGEPKRSKMIREIRDDGKPDSNSTYRGGFTLIIVSMGTELLVKPR
jgi:hypothetical protein